MLREKSKALDDLYSQINALSEKVGLAEESVKIGKPCYFDMIKLFDSKLDFYNTAVITFSIY